MPTKKELEALVREMKKELELLRPQQGLSGPTTEAEQLEAVFSAPTTSGRKTERQPGESCDSRPTQRPAYYDGKLPWEIYCLQFDIAAEINGWNEEKKGQFLASQLTGAAAAVLLNLPEEKSRSFHALSAALSARFGARKHREVAMVLLRERSRRRNETLQELAGDIEALVRQAYPKADEDTLVTLGVDNFVQAITDPEVQLEVRRRAPASVREAVELATHAEAIQLACRHSVGARQTVRGITQASPAEVKRDSEQGEEPLEACLRAMREMEGRLTAQANRQPAASRGGRRRPACFRCGSLLHLARWCDRPGTGGTSRAGTEERQNQEN